MDDPEYSKLKDKYELLNSELINEIENLKYLLDNTMIEYINLISIHYKLKDLIYKRDEVKNEIYNKFNEYIQDEV